MYFTLSRSLPTLALLCLSNLVVGSPTGARDDISSSAKSVVARLMKGNKHFVVNRAKHPDADPVRRREVAKGQKPDAIVFCCSDSRVPPEIVFDQGLGRLFVVRVAGEAIDANGAASIEYAVDHFHPKVLLVLGHDFCGAIEATLKTPEGKPAGSPDLDRLVASIRPHVAGYTIGKDPSLIKPVRANVDGVVKELTRRSKIIRDSINSKSMAAVRGVYRLKTGVVELW